MKTVLNVPREVDIRFVKVYLKIEEGHDDLPLKDLDSWSATIDVDTGKILEWPVGKSYKFYEKVVDTGTYSLIDEWGYIIKVINDYVPNSLIPGEYGDYIDLDIDENGVVTNWPKDPSLEDFFPN